MFQRFDGRTGHYALLLLVSAGLFLVNLGGPSLWDLDEGRNATAAQEMLEAQEWVVPTFNAQLRVDKPVLLYWLQILAYRLCGVNEFAARLPSALAALVTVLLTYELGRRLFGAATGLLGGLVLASTVLFCVSAHFANPDALLNACTILTFFLFWRSFAASGRAWLILCGASTGLAVLAKGPVGLALPAAAIGLFLLWSRQLRRLLDRRLVLGLLAFVLVALPWYVWVGVETKWQFLRGFLLTHNIDRLRNPMENHGGSVLYYAATLVVGFAPWSIFFGPAVWYALWSVIRRPWSAFRAWWEPAHDAECGKEGDQGKSRTADAYRFLWCWMAVYFLFFSLAATKLPSYILPLYPPLALLTARFLDRWRRGIVQPPVWTVHLGPACLALVGVVTILVLLAAGGVLRLALLRGRFLPGLESWAFLGVLPILGAVGTWWLLHRRQRGGVVAAVAVTAVLFVGALAAFGSLAFNRFKAPRPLVELAHALQRRSEIRIGCFQLEHLPSLNFYCQRNVEHQKNEAEVRAFLRSAYPSYLFLPAPAWQYLEARIDCPHRLLGRHPDLYRGCDVVVVSNRE
jgi:4-amino-4-deoxy-L-arabinose transferase-like glycosyltransferase